MTSRHVAESSSSTINPSRSRLVSSPRTSQAPNGAPLARKCAVTSPGLTDGERHELATFLRRELLAVEGVADVDVSGLPDEAIFVEPNMAITSNLG